MATPTANYGFIKDAPTQLYDVAVVNANLDSIDAAIKANANLISGNNTNMDNRVDKLEDYFNKDTAVLHSNPFNAAANWAITEERVYTWGPVVFGNLQVSRRNSTLPSNSTGDIGNILVATWATADYWKPYGGGESAWNHTNGGSLFGGYVSNLGVYINALLPGNAGDIGVNEYVWGSFMYLRNVP